MPAKRSSFAPLATGLLAAQFLTSVAFSQTVIEEIPFDGETITIMEMEDGQQALMLGDRELGRNWFAAFDRVTEVEGYPVALIYLGEGGNACGPATIILWRDDEGTIRSENYDEDCSSPAPAVSDNGIYFVPYVAPGETRMLKAWSPSDGMTIEGSLSFTPDPETNWSTLKGSELFHPLDFFTNADVYKAVAELTGDALETYAKGLRTASQPRRLASGIRMASGCVPHNCGGSDSFIAVDQAGEAVYLAQQEGEGFRFWPTMDVWPDAAVEAYQIFLNSR